jgi:RNA polymerase sigma-70 factor (ECF subfamily)
MKPERDVDRLVRQAQTGDRAAFDALAALHRGALEGLFRRRLGAELKRHIDVGDLVQETMLRAFGALERYRHDGEESFARWLRGIGLKVLLEAIRQKGRHRHIALDFEVSSGEPSPSRRAQRQERRERFEKAIASLSPEHRTALRLVRLEGLSVTEAARRMDRSPNAVSHLLIRGLEKLRENLGDTGSFHLAEEPPGGGSSSDG